MKEVTVYTDGSCWWKTKRGGIGIYMQYQQHELKYFEGCYINTSIGRMELLAVIKALQLLEDKTVKVTFYCDSQYVVNTCSIWAIDWERFDFVGRKNVDLLKVFLEEYRKFKIRPNFKWVKGHSNNIGNEIADSLAKKGYESLIEVEDKNFTLEN